MVDDFLLFYHYYPTIRPWLYIPWYKYTIGTKGKILQGDYSTITIGNEYSIVSQFIKPNLPIIPLYYDDTIIFPNVSGWWYTYTSEKLWSSSVGMMTFPIYGKIKHVPNHQPVTHHWICPNRPCMTLLCVQTTVRTWFQGKFVKHRLSYPNDLGCCVFF